MKVGDLVKVKSMLTSAIGIVICTNMPGKRARKMCRVVFPNLGYDMDFYQRQLEVINESR